MAKHDAGKRKTPSGARTPEREETTSTEFTLEEILAEFRIYQASIAGTEPAAETSLPVAEPRGSEPEIALSSREREVPTEPQEHEASASVNEPDPAPEPQKPVSGRAAASEDGLFPVREKRPPVIASHVPSWPPRDIYHEQMALTEDEVLGEMFAPEELKRAEEEAAKEEAALSAVLAAASSPEETDEDDSFFVGERMEIPPEEDSGSGEDLPEEETEENGTSGALKKKKDPERRHRLVSGWVKKASSALSGASRKRERKRAVRLSEPETVPDEMPAGKAARYYGSHVSALKLRTMAAGIVCILLLWIAVGSALGAGIPGRLAWDVRTAAAVSLVAQITVLILGLDVVTSGIISLFQGIPGGESLVVIASFSAILDTCFILATGNGSRGLPYMSVTSLSVFFALWGGWRSAKAYHDTFITLHHNPEPSVAVREDLPEQKGSVLRKVQRDPAGFVSRAETPSLPETTSASLFFPILCLSVLLALVLCLKGKDPASFFHACSLMLALGAAFGWLFSYPVLFSREAKRLMILGCADAGWAGARDAGAIDSRLLLQDTDIFPADAVEIVGIRLLDKSRAGEIISVTGSMLSRAGAGPASVFMELMRRHGAEPAEIEEFVPGEGGYRGMSGGKSVRVGTVGYMHLSGVKVMDKLRAENAVYTAIDNVLTGVFLLRYRPLATVHEALLTLRRNRRKPIFAGKDFNLDPQLLRRSFGVSPEGFEFPPLPDRCTLTDSLADSKGSVVGILPEDSIEPFVQLTESSRRLNRYGTLCTWCSVISAALGAFVFLVLVFRGGWVSAPAWRVALFMFIWLVPTAILRLLQERV